MYLSKTFKLWYSRLLPDLKVKVRNNPDIHPHTLIKKQACSKIPLDIKHTQIVLTKKLDKQKIFTKGIIYTNSPILKRDFENKNFYHIPFITTTRSFLGMSDTCPQLIIFPNKTACVPVIINNKTYLKNYFQVDKALKKIKANIKVVDEIAILKTNKNLIFFSRHKGFDYETLILDHEKSLKQELYKKATEIEKLSKVNLFFRNNAPRNIIKGLGEETYLIDFDNTFKLDKQNQVDIYLKYLSKKAWYYDIFSPTKVNGFLDKISLKDKDRIKIKASAFDAKFYRYKKGEIIPLAKIEHVYQQTYKLEQKDILQGIKIYGHELGRFISDYWDYSNEVELLKFIEKIDKQSLRIIRANLYLLSRVDQELMFRHCYKTDTNLSLLSKKYLQSLVKKNILLSKFKYAKFTQKLKGDNFYDIYKFAKKSITLTN